LAAHETIGLLLAQRGGLDWVMLELDNLTLVNFLRSVAGERSQIAGFWHEIGELSRVFSSFNVSYVNRGGNKAGTFF
jgi:hypothetical protein